MRKIFIALLAAVLFFTSNLAFADTPFKREFIFESAPFASCHASTIAESKDGLVAAWFGGTEESASDVCIWVSRNADGKWSPPRKVASGTDAKGQPVACWNPVLFQQPGGPLLLFYKVGPKPSAWWGMMMHSDDAGRAWSESTKLPEGILGPIKDKAVLLSDGTLLCPSSTEDRGWQAHVEMTRDFGKTWTKSGPLNDGVEMGLIQPTTLALGNNKLELLFRSQQHHIYQSISDDAGKTWSKPAATALPNPNSGIDAVTLKDGRSVLVYNDTPRGRSPLNVAISSDGQNWKPAAVLESERGEFSYPAVIQTADGMIHVTYTWKRKRIVHVVIDPAKLE